MLCLLSKLEEVKEGDRKNLINVLRNISEFDNDFTCKNGKDFLWEEAKEYNSNMEYLINKVKDIKDDEKCIRTFFNCWMEHDGDYYAKYQLSLILNEKKQVKVISFCAIYKD